MTRAIATPFSRFDQSVATIYVISFTDTQLMCAYLDHVIKMPVHFVSCDVMSTFAYMAYNDDLMTSVCLYDLHSIA